MKAKKISATAAIVVISLIAALGGYWLGRPGPIELTAATLYPSPKIIQPFELIGKDGQRVTKASWEGQWDLVFFGFTHCPDICPSVLTMMRGIRNKLTESIREERLPQVTLVSVDSERDTPARLKEYVEYFDPSFAGVTGTPEQIAAITKQLNIAYVIEDHEPTATSYNVDHFAGILLIDPQARVHGIFTMPHDPAAITEDLRKLLKG